MNGRSGDSSKNKEHSKMKIENFRELRVYEAAMNAALEIFNISKSFPSEEKYSLTDQIRRSSRSVCANIGEAWRKRRYIAAFIAKISDAETEACETKSGWNLHLNVITFKKINILICLESTTILSANW